MDLACLGLEDTVSNNIDVKYISEVSGKIPKNSTLMRKNLP